jgi:hypothetical protein
MKTSRRCLDVTLSSYLNRTHLTTHRLGAWKECRAVLEATVKKKLIPLRIQPVFSRRQTNRQFTVLTELYSYSSYEMDATNINTHVWFGLNFYVQCRSCSISRTRQGSSGYSPAGHRGRPCPTRVRFETVKLTLGHVFLWIFFFSVSIILPILHANYLHFNDTLISKTRRAKSENVKKMPFRILGSTGQKGTRRFKMFSVITNIYVCNKKTKGLILMELFTATEKLKKIFFFDN